MDRRTAVLAGIVVLAVIVLIIAMTRTRETERVTDRPAARVGAIQVWIGGDKAYRGLAEIGRRFTEDTGIRVIVEHPEDAPGRFQRAAAAGTGPDIMIWPHDRAGEWVASGLIEPVTPAPAFQDQFETVGWDAFSFDGALWGYPISIEAVGLVYNRALVPEPPRAFEDIFGLHQELSPQGRRAILWDYTNTYFTWPLLSANGGYAFGRTEAGAYDPGDVGVDHPGALIGARMLVQLIETGVMPRGADYAAMEAEMVRGNLGMMINGPWSWANLRRNNIDFGVAPIPTIQGNPGRPFIGVLGAMINRASTNKALAVELLEGYVLTMEGLRTMDDDVSLGVPAHREFYGERSDDPHVQGTMMNVQQGVLMPSHPAMSRFWSAMESALQNIAGGRQSPEEALAAAARRIRPGGG